MSFAFFFPGQGSQSLNMMAGFDGSAVVRQTFEQASAALGEDLWAMMNGEDAALIGQTVNTQPLMLAAGVATYRAYLEAGGKTPAAVAGHSLDEYSALVAAGSLDFADAVRLVRLRAMRHYRDYEYCKKFPHDVMHERYRSRYDKTVIHYYTGR